MKVYGLIGYPLSHSFSKRYFTEKFEKENISNCSYELFEIKSINQLPDVIRAQQNALCGLNVTIPHKQAVIPFLDNIDSAAERIGAVNVIKISGDGHLMGYNSDYFGFLTSLKKQVDDFRDKKALILGTGGASKAVKTALEDLGIPFSYVSRKSSTDILSYDDITEDIVSDHKIIINTTPLGMYPSIDQCPDLPYEGLSSSHFLFDLVYNPLETKFMKLGLKKGANVKNGLEMLELQAEKAWEIWNL